MPLSDCYIVDLPRVLDSRGSLTFIEGCVHIPFQIKRVYYIYDIPGGSNRGSHSHRNLKQFIICMSGSFDVVLNDGSTEKRFHLNRSFRGLFVSPMIWRYLDNFSSGAVCMALVSDVYSELDYIRDYDQFLKELKVI